MNDKSSLQNIFTEGSKENLKKALKEEITTFKNNLINYKHEVTSVCEEIVSCSTWWKDIVNKNIQYDVLAKKNEKYSYDILYTDAEIQYFNKEIGIAKDHISEIETLIKDEIVNLKEIEHEKDVACAKIVDKKNAYDRAAKYYKRLNLYINVKKEDDVLLATICYRTQKFDDTYSFIISKNDNNDKWILKSVKPQLKDTQFMALQKRFNSSNNMSCLLCTLRKIFNMYINSRK